MRLRSVAAGSTIEREPNRCINNLATADDSDAHRLGGPLSQSIRMNFAEFEINEDWRESNAPVKSAGVLPSLGLN
jgi:hypothetical protein